jgi:hypothetical protein
LYMIFVFMILVFLIGVSASAKTPDDASEWTIYITNDNCPDYTWGYTEEQTRQSFADIVRAHLDEMKRTDAEATENRDRYNMAVTQEALCFVERYPERKDELIQRIKEGRIYVSPYLCNSLWALQSFEGAIRTFYPARRLEREWGIPFGVAEHIEEPSLPWGMASILSGCGIKWLSNPFYRYGSTFTELENPPVFIFEGPDGGRIRVVMDPWACVSFSYMQGGRLLREPNRIMEEWIPHYQGLGDSYPARAILASGTHGDISPRSGDQVRGFADAIIDYNKSSGKHPKLVNSILPQFCAAIDEAQTQRPFLKVIRGCFGHSWDVWPVSLAKYVAGMRTGERSFLAAEALLSVASQVQSDLKEATRSHRERGEWLLAMLSDHAWNGTDDNNKRHNAELRRLWGEELKQISGNLIREGWKGVGVTESDDHLSIFNSLSIPRSDLVRIQVPTDVGVMEIDSQIVQEDGKHVLYFVSPEIPGFGLRQLSLKTGIAESATNSNLRATSTELECPYYRLVIDPETGGISSLTHKPTDTELVAHGNGRTLCQAIYFDGEEHLVANVSSEVVANGPVLARLRVTGTIEGIKVTNLITVYAHLDRVDFDIHITRPSTEKEERLCQVFPILQDGAVLRIETTGAVIRPEAQPEGDLLPGADTRRFAVQGFVDASLPDGAGVAIAPLDAFLLRLDLDPVTFEALGNDQNYREVSKDQNGETEFRFRYSLTARADGYKNAEAFNWSRSVANPLLVVKGDIGSSNKLAACSTGTVGGCSIEIDPNRAIATCLKPAEENGCVMRLREVAGQSGPISVYVKGYRKVFLTDLLERDIEELKVVDGEARFDLLPHGFAGLRFLQ